MGNNLGKSVGSELVKLGKDTLEEAGDQVKKALKDVVSTTGVNVSSSPDNNEQKKKIAELAQKDHQESGADLARARQMIREQQAREAQYNRQKDQQVEEAMMTEQAKIEREKRYMHDQQQQTDLSSLGSKSNMPRSLTFAPINKEKDKKHGM